MKVLIATATLALLAALAGSRGAAGAPVEGETARALHALFDEAWAFSLQEGPLLASAVGDKTGADRLPAMGQEDLARRERFWRDVERRLGGLDRTALGDVDQANLAVFEREVRDGLAEHEFQAWRMPFNADSGFWMAVASLPRQTAFLEVEDYEAYLARLRAVPRYFAEQTALMRQGLRDGFTQPRTILAGIDAGIAAHAVDDPRASVFWAPFESFPEALPEAERERLRLAGTAAIREAVAPAYRELAAFMRDEYVPSARETTGASELPRGREYYANRVRHFTTLARNPDEIHAIGQAEVKRIRAEMEAVMRGTGFTGTFAEFLEFLRTDARFYAKTPEQLLKQAAWIAKRMDAQLPSLFGKLPRLPYGVEPVPDAIAPKYTGGRYVPAPIGGTRAGTYWVNTYALENRPLYTLEALTLHEAVPGHHLQIALQQELEDLPAFRRVAGVDAYVEGWALYAERLGLEAGFYTDPYSNFGRLTYEMWRACRLVVDTGLHALGWSREQALDFLAANTALSHHEIRTETDRYIGWPGQALGYKMGEIAIRELRREAEQALGPRFDRRAFHDVILESGPEPLGLLEERVRAWIERSRPAT